MKRVLPLAALILAGCGGGGSSSGGGSTPVESPWAGTYSGPFTSSITGTLAGTSAGSPPSSGTAVMTVNSSGDFNVTLGTGYRGTGTLNADGSTLGSVHWLYVHGLSESFLPGTASMTKVGINASGSLRGAVDPSNYIQYTLNMTKTP